MHVDLESCVMSSIPVEEEHRSVGAFDIHLLNRTVVGHEWSG